MKTAETADVDTALDVEGLSEKLGEHPLSLAILFGSHAEGDAHSSSDVDIAVEFEDLEPTDDGYNDAFFGLSVDLSESLGTDAVDIVDLRTASPVLVNTIFDRGVLLVGDQSYAATRRRQLAIIDEESPSPRDRFDAAVTRIDAHLDEDRNQPDVGTSVTEG